MSTQEKKNKTQAIVPFIIVGKASSHDPSKIMKIPAVI